MTGAGSFLGASLAVIPTRQGGADLIALTQDGKVYRRATGSDAGGWSDWSYAQPEGLWGMTYLCVAAGHAADERGILVVLASEGETLYGWEYVPTERKVTLPSETPAAHCLAIGCSDDGLSGMFALEADGQLSNTWRWPGATGWSAWQLVDAPVGFTSITSTAYGNRGLVLHAAGSDGAFWQRVWESEQGWYGWQRFGTTGGVGP